MPHSFPTLSSSVLVFVVRFADDGSVSFFGHCRLTFVSENGGADECAEAESLGDVAVVGGDRGQAEATRHFNEAGPLVGGEVAICAVLFRKNEFGGALNFVGFLQTHQSGKIGRASCREGVCQYV